MAPWHRGVVSDVLQPKEEGKAKASLVRVKMEEGPKQGEFVEVPDVPSSLRCWSSSTLALCKQTNEVVVNGTKPRRRVSHNWGGRTSKKKQEEVERRQKEAAAAEEKKRRKEEKAAQKKKAEEEAAETKRR